MSPVRVFVNAAGSNSGGGRTYVLALIDELAHGGTRDVDWAFLVQREVLPMLPPADVPGLRLISQPDMSPLRRILWEQVSLPRQTVGQFDVLLSAANFSPLARRSRTILLTRNALHFVDFRVSGRRQRRRSVETMLARASVRRARVTVTATAAMAELVRGRTGRRPVVIPFGPGLVRSQAPGQPGVVRFAHRTLWGAHKRFRDVLLAVGELALTHPGRFIVRSGCDPASDFARSYPESEEERRLLEDPLIAEHVSLGTFGPRAGSEIEGDAVLMPSTIESFCFPLAEGLSLGLPIVAADSDFARELCGHAAIYVAPGDPRALAEGMRRVIDGDVPDPPAPERLEILSWQRHADRLAALCRYVAKHDRAHHST